MSNPLGTVTKTKVQLVTDKAQPTVEDRGFEDCCYKRLVLADDTGKARQNDKNGFAFKVETETDTVNMFLVDSALNEVALVNDDYGTFFDFGDMNTLQKGYEIEWSKVLDLEGADTYRIKSVEVILGENITTFSDFFCLKTYSIINADNTIRIDTIQNGFLRHDNFDYTDLNWRDSVRVDGFFGNREPEYETKEILYQNRELEQISDELVNFYKLDINPVPVCIGDRIIEYHMLANDIRVTDYNGNNYSYNFNDVRVTKDTVDESRYLLQKRDLKLRFTMKDRVQDFEKTNC